MCINIVQEPGKILPEEYIDVLLKRCPDGIGMTWVSKHGELSSFHTLDGDAFKKAYSLLCVKGGEGNDSPVVIVFRNCTAGEKNIENLHPFMCNDTTAFVHNGYFADIKDMKSEGEKPYSDTYLFNEKILKMLHPDFFHNDAIMFKLITHYANGDVLIFLNKDKTYKIINQQKGHWKDGIFYSNSMYKVVEPVNHNTQFVSTCDICFKTVPTGSAIILEGDTIVDICKECFKSNTVSKLEIYNLLFPRKRK